MARYTPAVIALLIAASRRELATLAGLRYVQQPEALRANSDDAMSRKLFGFLDRRVMAYRAKQ